MVYLLYVMLFIVRSTVKIAYIYYLKLLLWLPTDLIIKFISFIS